MAYAQAYCGTSARTVLRFGHLHALSTALARAIRHSLVQLTCSRHTVALAACVLRCCDGLAVVIRPVDRGDDRPVVPCLHARKFQTAHLGTAHSTLPRVVSIALYYTLLRTCSCMPPLHTKPGWVLPFSNATTWCTSHGVPARRCSRLTRRLTTPRLAGVGGLGGGARLRSHLLCNHHRCAHPNRILWVLDLYAYACAGHQAHMLA